MRVRALPSLAAIALTAALALVGASAAHADGSLTADQTDVSVGDTVTLTAQIGDLSTAGMGISNGGELTTTDGQTGATVQAPNDGGGNAVVTFTPTEPGSYDVYVSDGETDTGNVTITVTAADTPAPTPTPVPEPTQPPATRTSEPAPEPTVTPVPASSSTDVAQWVVIAIVAVLLVAAIITGVVLYSRRRRT